MGIRQSATRTWNGHRWAYMLLGLACGLGTAWWSRHWTFGGRWPLLLLLAAAILLFAVALLASDETMDYFVEHNDGSGW